MKKKIVGAVVLIIIALGIYFQEELLEITGIKSKTVIPYEKGFVKNLRFYDVYSFEEGLAAIEQNGKWGFMDKQGKIIIKPKFEIVRDFSVGLAAVLLNGSWGFIDKKGKIIMEPQFECVREFSEGLVAVRIDGIWGFMDKTGKLIISAQYDSVNSF